MIVTVIIPFYERFELLERAINSVILQKVLKNVSGITQIIVSTDCDIAAAIAHKQSIKVQRRSKYYAGSDVTNDQHWLHIAKTTPGDIVFLAQVTSPLLKVSSIQKALNTFLNSKEKLRSFYKNNIKRGNALAKKLATTNPKYFTRRKKR